MTGTVRRVLLVGFMGSGKTSVGRRLAESLGWRFVDTDADVERRVGLPIARIFADHGESVFRDQEKSAVAEAMREEDVVIAPGGGWAARPEWASEVGAGTLAVWLRVGPEAAVERASRQGDTRPLLAVDDPLAAASELIRVRDPYYGLAPFEVDTEGSSVEDVTARIREILAEIDPSADAS